MKFSTLVALTATVSARHIIDGAVAEDVQDQLMDAADDIAEFAEHDLIPNLEQYDRDQYATQRQYERESEQNFNDFVARGDAAGYDAKLDAIADQIDQAMRDLDNNARANGFARRRAAPAMGLWSVGMTSSKTQAVNTKL